SLVFFFQAEDGIRDRNVTGVQTCALPISKNRSAAKMKIELGKLAEDLRIGDSIAINGVCLTAVNITKGIAEFEVVSETIKKTNRSEERRVGKECKRRRWE